MEANWKLIDNDLYVQFDACRVIQRGSYLKEKKNYTQNKILLWWTLLLLRAFDGVTKKLRPEFDVELESGFGHLDISPALRIFTQLLDLVI